SNIVLTFSENVVAGTGNIVISDGIDTRTIAVTDATQVTISGNTVTIDPTNDLHSAYSVQMADGVIQDVAGNHYAGILDNTTLNFTTPPASAISLSTLNGSTGFRLDGVAAGDLSGESARSAGDINGDGFDDLVVGAYHADPDCTDSGSSYVVFGHASGFVSAINLSSLNGSTGFRLDGEAAADWLGISVSSAGDVNGDGFADLIVGADGAPAGPSYAGSTYVVFGKASGFSSAIDLSSLNGSTGFRLDGVSSGDCSGKARAVSSAGDVNGDGFNDLIVGAGSADPNGTDSGSSYVVFGKASGFNSAINLASLDGNTGFCLNGVTAWNHAGDSISSAGDINGDGFADLIIGAVGASPNGHSWAGSSYVVFGHSGSFNAAINLASLDGSTGFRLDGVAANDWLGFAVSSAGDVNGDGFGDLIVGANRADPNGSYSGSSYVVFGKASGFNSVINLASLDGSTGFRLDGVATNDNSGFVSSAGDVNGDGFDDLIVGAPGTNGSVGSSYVIFGHSGGFISAITLSNLDGSTGFRLDGVTAGDQSGYSVNSAGDINGDGFDDLIVGAAIASPSGITRAGASYVIFGKATGSNSAINLSSLDGSTGFRLSGVASYDISGFSVSSAGDVNGDGFGDLIVGAYKAPSGISYAGSSYVVFGKATGFSATISLASLNGSTGFRLDGAASNDRVGVSVSSAGDINGDGFDDLIVGAMYADPNGASHAGSTYVVFGKATGFNSVINPASLDGNTGFRLDGVAAGDQLGWSVSSAGDVNGDGFDDLIVGAKGADPNSTIDAGSSYVVFGKATGFSSAINLSTLNGSTGFRLDGVVAIDNSGRSVSSAGDVNG
ncbi:MAG: FG-GAP repeat protein, partial [Magnetococcales bacterium]|nr:FG-GAP repeat protein [Magnetococcales bacterium]